MWNKILLALAILAPAAYAESPVVWHGTLAKSLASTGFEQNDAKVIRILSVDPSAGAGVAAAIGSIGQRSNAGSGELWIKTGAADTAWTLDGTGGGTVTSFSVVTANGVSASVANPSTTPAATFTLGAITPSSVAATGTVTGSNLSGTNSGDITLASFGSTPAAEGASLSGQVLTLQPASGAQPGGVSTTTQSFAGVKTFVSPPTSPNGKSLTEVWGASITNPGDQSTYVGNGINGQSASNSTLMGRSVSGSAAGGDTLVGQSVTAGVGGGATGVGNAVTVASGSVGVGSSVTCQKNSVCVGSGTNAADNTTGQNILVGKNTAATGTANNNLIVASGETLVSQNNHAIFGTSSSPYTAWYMGSGKTAVSPGTVTFQGTGGSGADNAGSSVVWAPGKSTGSATPADFRIQATTAGVSSSTLQTLSEVARFNITGLGLGNIAPSVMLDVNGNIRDRGLTTAGPVSTDASGNLSSAATLGVASGGTGLATLTAHAVQVGNGTSAVTQVGPNASTVFPLVSGGSSADPLYALLTVPGGGTGLATLTAHALQVGNGASAVSQVGPNASTVFPLVSGGSSADPAYALLTVPGGGTGAATLTNHGVLVGAGASAITQLAAAGAGTLLGGVASSDPAFSRTPVLGLAGTGTGSLGFSGTTSGTVTVQPQAAAGTYNFNLPTAAGTSGQPLLSGGGGGAAQTYGTLGVAAGGSGQTSYTDGQLLIGNSSGNTLTKATLTAGSGITITNGGGSITIAASGGGGATISNAITQTGHGFSVGDVVYYTGSAYAKAKADADATAESLGVVSVVTDANNFTLVMAGYVSTLSGLTAGSTYYLSASSAGATTTSAPSTSGQVSKPVLVAVSTTAAYIIQSRGVIVGSGGGGGASVGETTIGGMTFTNTGLKILRNVNATTAKTHFMDVSPGSTSHSIYQVTAGKTFVMYAYCVEIISATGNTVGNKLLYADNDVGVESATAATNPVGVLSGVASGDVTDTLTGAKTDASDLVVRCYAAGGSIPAAKYPYIDISIRSTTTLYGYEI